MLELNGLLSKAESLREKSSRLAKLPKFSRAGIIVEKSIIDIKKLRSELKTNEIKAGWLRTQSRLFNLKDEALEADEIPLAGEWVINEGDKNTSSKHLQYLPSGKWSLTSWQERNLGKDKKPDCNEHEALSQTLKLIGTDGHEFTYHVYWKGTENDPSAIERFGARLVSISKFKQ